MHEELGARADHEVEGVVVGGEVVAEDVVVEVEALVGCGALGVCPNHGVEGEEVGVVRVVEEVVGVVEVGWVVKGYGGHELAMQVGVVEDAVDE